MSKNESWRVVAEHVYETFRIFQVKRTTKINPRTGNPFDFFLIDGLDWVNVIALTEDNQVLLVEQHRHGSNERTIEIPGGCIEKDEPDPMKSAERELMEETGYAAKSMELIGVLRPNPAMLSNKLYVYAARGIEKVSGQTLDAGEDISFYLKPMSEVRDMISKGDINHALVVAAFGLLKL